MKNSVLVFLVALIVGGAAASGLFLAQPNPLTPRVKQLEAEMEKARTEVTQTKAEVEKVKAERVKLQDELKAATAEVTAQKKQVAELKAAVDASGKGRPSVVSGKAGGQPPGGEAGNAMRKMMESPGMRDMMRKQQEVQVDMTYGPLFKKLKLDDAEKENLRRLLADRATSQAELGIKMLDSNLTEEDRKKVVAGLDAAKKQSDADIEKFMNNADDYKTFQDWEGTTGERMELQMGESYFNQAGEPLTEPQRDKLIQTMVEAHKQSGALPDMNQPRNFSFANLSEDAIDRQLKHQDEMNAWVRQQAAGFLSPAQIEALQKMQDQFRTMSEAGLKMTGQMFGGKK